MPTIVDAARRNTRNFTLLICALVALLSGCGSCNNNETIVVNNSASPGVPTARVICNPTLAGETLSRSEPVPASVTGFRLTGFNASGQAVYGPQVFPKAPTLSVDLPVTVTVLQNDDLETALARNLL